MWPNLGTEHLTGKDLQFYKQQVILQKRDPNDIKWILTEDAEKIQMNNLQWRGRRCL